ncbi:MAG: tRNA (guanosine(46)-N7)-methyltransferase TrmB [SAR324 cluster bacterium]|nr:tRNA (guanosine(46)-N7)-methyltransferase TrmB [SAR324 cluster bacterium]
MSNRSIVQSSLAKISLMMSTTAPPNKVNPYCDWIYDYPANLIPEPTPELLYEKRTAGPVCSQRVLVELGSGSGNFLLQLGQHWPGCHLVGFELRYKRLVKAARKLEKEGLRNVWLLREEAEQFYRYFPAGGIDDVFVNFPDPWPKAGQWKKRLINPELLLRLETALRPGGRLHLKTDHSGYFLHVLSLLRDMPHWSIMHFSNDLHRYGPPLPNVRTEFEQLFAAKQKAVFFLTVEHAG